MFDLLGDFNSDGQAEANHVSGADYTIWSQNYGHVLQLLDVGV